MGAKNLKPHIKYSSKRKQWSVSVGGMHIGSGRTLESMWHAHRARVYGEIHRLEDEPRRVAAAQAVEAQEEERKRLNLERAREMFRNGTYQFGPETLGLLPEA